MLFQLDTFHNLIVVSPDPDAKYFPSSEKTTSHTGPEWAVRVFMHTPLDTLHNLIVLSPDPDTKYSPSLENTTLNTKDE